MAAKSYKNIVKCALKVEFICQKSLFKLINLYLCVNQHNLLSALSLAKFRIIVNLINVVAIVVLMTTNTLPVTLTLSVSIVLVRISQLICPVLSCLNALKR